MAEVNAMDPTLLQAALTPTGTVTALVQAPVVLTYLDGKGVRISDSVAEDASAKRGIAEPERLHPRDHQAGDRRSPRRRPTASSPADDQAALVDQLKALKVDVNPRYGSYDPNTASVQLTTPGWVTPQNAAQ